MPVLFMTFGVKVGTPTKVKLDLTQEPECDYEPTYTVTQGANIAQITSDGTNYFATVYPTDNEESTITSIGIHVELNDGEFGAPSNTEQVFIMNVDIEADCPPDLETSNPIEWAKYCGDSKEQTQEEEEEEEEPEAALDSDVANKFADALLLTDEILEEAQQDEDEPAFVSPVNPYLTVLPFSFDGRVTLKSSCPLRPLKNKENIFKAQNPKDPDSAPSIAFEINYAAPTLAHVLAQNKDNITLVQETGTTLVFQVQFYDPSLIPSSSFTLDKLEIYIFNLELLKCTDGRLFTKTLQVPMSTAIPP